MADDSKSWGVVKLSGTSVGEGLEAGSNFYSILQHFF
jgi:hypothetical protein